jgi:hypothetical protein
MPENRAQNNEGRNGKPTEQRKNGTRSRGDFSKEELAYIKKSMVTYSRERLQFRRNEAERTGQLAVEVLTSPSEE